MLKLAATVAACACVSQAIQTAFLAGAVASIPIGFFAAQLCVLLVLHLAAALVFGPRLGGRAWAAAAFLTPVSFALLPIVREELGPFASLGLLGGSGLGWVAFSLWGRVSVSPESGSALGAFLGAAVLRFRYWSASPAGELGVVEALFIGAAGACVLLLVWLDRRAADPRPSGRTAFLAIASLGAAIAMAPVGPGARIVVPDPPREAVSDQPPVVLVVLDTVRADHLDAYGYPRETMPGLHAFAREHGVRVERAISSSSWTLPSHASMFTGLEPPHHHAHSGLLSDPAPPELAYPLRPDAPLLASLLAKAGYWTAGIVANFGPLAPEFGLSRGFHFYDASRDPLFEMRRLTPWRFATRTWWPPDRLDRLLPGAPAEFFGRGVPYRRARWITSAALDVVQKAGDRSFFLFVNYMDAHSPYDPPGDFRGRFPGVRPEAPRTPSARTRELPSPELVEHMTALYDGELAYLDFHLRALLNALASHPRFPEMLVIVTSDHGESFGEHEMVSHGTSLYGEQTRVPLILKLGRGSRSSWRPGSVIPGPISSVDLFPLILEHAGLRPPDTVDGVPLLEGRTHAFSWLYVQPHALELGSEFRRELRSVESTLWKLIESTPGRVELLQLSDDGSELGVPPTEEGSVREALLARLREVEEGDSVGPSAAGGLSQKTRDQLRELGYVE